MRRMSINEVLVWLKNNKSWNWVLQNHFTFSGLKEDFELFTGYRCFINSKNYVYIVETSDHFFYDGQSWFHVDANTFDMFCQIDKEVDFASVSKDLSLFESDAISRALAKRRLKLAQSKGCFDLYKRYALAMNVTDLPYMATVYTYDG